MKNIISIFSKFMFAIVVCLLFVLSNPVYSKTISYKQTLSGNTFFNKWTIKTSTQNRVLVGNMATGLVKLISDNANKTHSWSYISETEKTDLKVHREENKLIMLGTVHGKTVNKKVKIDDNPWIQVPGLQLTNFIKSDKKLQEFWIVSVENATIEKLIVYKKNRVNLEVDKKSFPAQRVKITLPDFRGMFWSAWYWFNEENGLFIKYKGLNGGPGSPETVVTLHTANDKH